MDVNILGHYVPFGLRQSIDFYAHEIYMDDQPNKYFLFETEDSSVGDNVPKHDEEMCGFCIVPSNFTSVSYQVEQSLGVQGSA
jgi:hypothetical protein